MKKSDTRTKINIGCGPTNFGKEWIHIDGGDYDHVDFKDPYLSDISADSIDLIYASHVLEYFDDEEAIHLLTHWRLRLKPGGRLKLAVPDLEKLKLLDEPLSRWIGPLYGKMKMGDKFIYHKTGYDEQRLRALLLFCGFRKIRVTIYPLHGIDDHSHAPISLNMEAVK